MDNFFITEFFDWQIKRRSVLDRGMTRLLKKLGIHRQFASAATFDVAVNTLLGNFNPNRQTEPLAALYSGLMTNIEQRMNMYHLVAQVLAYGVPGDLVELGCNEGQSAVLIQKTILDHDPSRKLHLYDSFEGLPAISERDGSVFQQGWMATTEEIVRDNFRRYGLAPPLINKGWFKDTLPDTLPERICFAHLDGDLYDSILVSLEHVYPRLSTGAICLVDDYADTTINSRARNDLPGVKKACDDFLRDKTEKVSSIYSGTYPHGFFRKS